MACFGRKKKVKDFEGDDAQKGDPYRNATHRLRLYEELTDVMYFETDKSGNLQYASANVKRLLGWDFGEIQGLKEATLLHPEDANFAEVEALSIVHLHKHGSKGTVEVDTLRSPEKTITLRRRQKSGFYLWVESTFQVLRDPKRPSKIDLIVRLEKPLFNEGAPDGLGVMAPLPQPHGAGGQAMGSEALAIASKKGRRGSLVDAANAIRDAVMKEDRLKQVQSEYLELEEAAVNLRKEFERKGGHLSSGVGKGLSTMSTEELTAIREYDDDLAELAHGYSYNVRTPLQVLGFSFELLRKHLVEEEQKDLLEHVENAMFIIHRSLSSVTDTVDRSIVSSIEGQTGPQGPGREGESALDQSVLRSRPILPCDLEDLLRELVDKIGESCYTNAHIPFTLDIESGLPKVLLDVDTFSNAVVSLMKHLLRHSRGKSLGISIQRVMENISPLTRRNWARKGAARQKKDLPDREALSSNDKEPNEAKKAGNGNGRFGLRNLRQRAEQRGKLTREKQRTNVGKEEAEENEEDDAEFTSPAPIADYITLEVSLDEYDDSFEEEEIREAWKKLSVENLTEEIDVQHRKAQLLREVMAGGVEAVRAAGIDTNGVPISQAVRDAMDPAKNRELEIAEGHISFCDGLFNCGRLVSFLGSRLSVETSQGYSKRLRFFLRLRIAPNVDFLPSQENSFDEEEMEDCVPSVLPSFSSMSRSTTPGSRRGQRVSFQMGASEPASHRSTALVKSEPGKSKWSTVRDSMNLIRMHLGNTSENSIESLDASGSSSPRSSSKIGRLRRMTLVATAVAAFQNAHRFLKTGGPAGANDRKASAMSSAVSSPRSRAGVAGRSRVGSVLGPGGANRPSLDLSIGINLNNGQEPPMPPGSAPSLLRSNAEDARGSFTLGRKGSSISSFMKESGIQKMLSDKAKERERRRTTRATSLIGAVTGNKTGPSSPLVSVAIEEEDEKEKNLSLPVRWWKLRILFADDNGPGAVLGQRVLQEMGHEVETAVSGKEALQKLCDEEQHFDMAIVAFRLPLMNADILSVMYRDWESSHWASECPTYICIMQSSPSVGDVEKCRRNGADSIVVKPLHADALKAHVLAVRLLRTQLERMKEAEAAKAASARDSAASPRLRAKTFGGT